MCSLKLNLNVLIWEHNKSYKHNSPFDLVSIELERRRAWTGLCRFDNLKQNRDFLDNSIKNLNIYTIFQGKAWLTITA